MQENEIRKAGDYEITHAIHIGEKELVLGENLSAEDGMCYLVAYCETNGMLQRYTDCMISDDFVEVAEIFAERLQAQVQQVKEEHEQIPIPTNPIGWDQCIPMHECGDIENKIVVVRPSVLRAEHRIATKQIYIAKSGNGVKAQSRGTAVYCDNLYTGNHTRFERYDFMGVLNPEHYPEWVIDRIKDMPNLQKQKKDKEPER